MGKSIQSELMGVFIYDEDLQTFELNKAEIHWRLGMKNPLADKVEMIKRAEKIFLILEEFDQKAKMAIAEKLLDYKNNFWPEYDEDDENLNWDAVDAGEYDVTKEEFAKAITLYDIEIRANEIYCEYNDGDLFGGHRIHAFFDHDYRLLNANV